MSREKFTTGNGRENLAVIERLIKATGCKSQRELAAYLEVTPGYITNAVRRDKIPEAWLYKVGLRTRRRVEWLLTGQGPEFLNEAAAEAVDFGRSALVRRCAPSGLNSRCAVPIGRVLTGWWRRRRTCASCTPSSFQNSTAAPSLFLSGGGFRSEKGPVPAAAP
jgi:hypothetical protein